MSSDHASKIKRSNRTVSKAVSQGDLSLKESIGTRTVWVEVSREN
jgi:hypothetical protein